MTVNVPRNMTETEAASGEERRQSTEELLVLKSLQET